MWFVVLAIETFEELIYALESIFEPRRVGNIEKHINLRVWHFVSKEIVHIAVGFDLYVLTYIVGVIASSFCFCDYVMVVCFDFHIKIKNTLSPITSPTRRGFRINTVFVSDRTSRPVQ